ncbi:hypothetical protein FNO01nite_06200 [Flavobacterium noncentrifugens]|uniref:Uncharacterized protein n=1 Tax=Flavobacterium noncentrifugens TaxID=1128970 RepID=A0A1G8SSG8_9FLAO|nr:hypothetical protein [Flavobacterium noncentrifugens]GEP49948.1 hypothetical protein FNO01nite_06200 [Flavobacterium noncentrifugens]SDJ32186.1 hypothetical protein SAMN04487935_0681 [Flavobacterium noncentrifugens]
MKKLFYLFAAILFGLSATAQNNTFAKSSMVVIVSQAKTTFTKGTSYKDWLNAQVGNTVPNAQEEKLLKEVYGFLTAGSNSEAIFKNSEGTSLTELSKVKNGAVFAQATAQRGLWMFLVRLIIEILIEVVAP